MQLRRCRLQETADGLPSVLARASQPCRTGRRKVRDSHRRHGLLLPKRRLRTAGLEPDQVGLVDEDLRRLFDEHNPVLDRNHLGDGVEQGCLPGAGAPGNQDNSGGP